MSRQPEVIPADKLRQLKQSLRPYVFGEGGAYFLRRIPLTAKSDQYRIYVEYISAKLELISHPVFGNVIQKKRYPVNQGSGEVDFEQPQIILQLLPKLLQQVNKDFGVLTGDNGSSMVFVPMADSDEKSLVFFHTGGKNPKCYCYVAGDSGEQLGTGAHGKVKKAYLVNLDTGAIDLTTPLAVKVRRLAREYCTADDNVTMREEHQREYQGLVAAQDPYTQPPVFINLGEHDDMALLVMERSGDGDLATAQRIDGVVVYAMNPKYQGLSFLQRTSACFQLALQIHLWHSLTPSTEYKRRVHLDLKSMNTRLGVDPVTRAVRASFIDFGFNQEFKSDSSQVEKMESRAGTPPNVPIELFQNSEFSPASDIYSGTEVFLMLLGVKAPTRLRQASAFDFRTDLDYYEIGYDYKGLLEGFELPNLKSQSEALKVIVLRFMKRMGALDYTQRPTADEVLLFFNTLYQLAVITEKKHPDLPVAVATTATTTTMSATTATTTASVVGDAEDDFSDEKKEQIEIAMGKLWPLCYGMSAHFIEEHQAYDNIKLVSELFYVLSTHRSVDALTQPQKNRLLRFIKFQRPLMYAIWGSKKLINIQDLLDDRGVIKSIPRVIGDWVGPLFLRDDLQYNRPTINILVDRFKNLPPNQIKFMLAYLSNNRKTFERGYGMLEHNLIRVALAISLIKYNASEKLIKCWKNRPKKLEVLANIYVASTEQTVNIDRLSEKAFSVMYYFLMAEPDILMSLYGLDENGLEQLRTQARSRLAKPIDEYAEKRNSNPCDYKGWSFFGISKTTKVAAANQYKDDLEKGVVKPQYNAALFSGELGKQFAKAEAVRRLAPQAVSAASAD